MSTSFEKDWIAVKADSDKSRTPKKKVKKPKKKQETTILIPTDETYGASLGALIGHGAQHLLKYITGFGDYQIQGNSLMNTGMNPPEIINKSKNYICVKHREYVADINGTSAFTLQSFPINPGLVATFPWLSGVADNFEEYLFTGIVFEFRSTTADYATNTALGAVIMATSYDALDPLFPDKKTMENYQFANSSKPSKTFIHPVECSKNPLSELYVRTGSVPTGADQRLYDLGVFQIATVGNPSLTSTIGELWITYEVCLYKPRMIQGIGYAVLSDHWQLAGMSSAKPFGNITGSPISMLQPGSSIQTSINSTGTTLTFPSTITNGTYLVVYTVTGTSVASLVAPTISLSTVTPLQVWQNDNAINVSNTGTTGLIFIFNIVVKITGPSQSLIFTTNTMTLPGNVTYGDLWITQLNGNIST